MFYRPKGMIQDISLEIYGLRRKEYEPKIGSESGLGHSGDLFRVFVQILCRLERENVRKRHDKNGEACRSII